MMAKTTHFLVRTKTRGIAFRFTTLAAAERYAARRGLTVTPVEPLKA